MEGGLGFRVIGLRVRIRKMKTPLTPSTPTPKRPNTLRLKKPAWTAPRRSFFAFPNTAEEQQNSHSSDLYNGTVKSISLPLQTKYCFSPMGRMQQTTFCKSFCHLPRPNAMSNLSLILWLGALHSPFLVAVSRALGFGVQG